MPPSNTIPVKDDRYNGKQMSRRLMCKVIPSAKATSLSCPNPMDPSDNQRLFLESRYIWVFKLNSAATGSLT